MECNAKYIHLENVIFAFNIFVKIALNDLTFSWCERVKKINKYNTDTATTTTTTVACKNCYE